jgi:putative ABC transport system permease protein
MPPDRVAFTDGYEIDRKPMPPGSERVAVPIPFVSRDYLKTLGIPLLRGRWFDNRDTADTPEVTVISEAMARRDFPGEDPVGQRLKRGGKGSPNPYMEIIGIVGNATYQGLDNGETAVFYQSTTQVPMRPMWLVLRTQQDARGLAPTIRKLITTLDPGVPVDRVSTMAQALDESVSMPRFRSLAMSIFAATALLLAAIGIYSVIAYSVMQRTQEIGVRMALGATPSRVLRQVVGGSGRLTLIGVVIGISGALGLTRLLKNMLFGVTAFDTFTFAGAVGILGAVAIVASLARALRAARVDPVTALRHD